MSHVVKIDTELRDLAAVEAACKRLGWVFLRDKKTYEWYGRHVGDYPIPKGMAKEDMGKCEHAISIPGVKYEVGLVKSGSGWAPIYDFYDSSLKQAMGGIKAEKFMQAYAVEKAKIEARKKGYKCQETKLDNGSIRLTINAR